MCSTSCKASDFFQKLKCLRLPCEFSKVLVVIFISQRIDSQLKQYCSSPSRQELPRHGSNLHSQAVNSRKQFLGQIYHHATPVVLADFGMPQLDCVIPGKSEIWAEHSNFTVLVAHCLCPFICCMADSSLPQLAKVFLCFDSETVISDFHDALPSLLWTPCPCHPTEVYYLSKNMYFQESIASFKEWGVSAF